MYFRLHKQPPVCDEIDPGKSCRLHISIFFDGTGNIAPDDHFGVKIPFDVEAVHIE